MEMGPAAELIIPLSFSFSPLLIFFGFMMRWGRRRLANLKAIESSGLEARGRVVSNKTYWAKGGEGHIIRYEFSTQSGTVQKGKCQILTERMSRPDAFPEGAAIPVLYLAERESVNFPKDLLADKMVPAEQYSRQITIAFKIILTVCVLGWILVYFFPQHQ